MKICYFGTYSAGDGYPVNRILIDGLRRAGAVVWECRASVAGDGEHSPDRWKSGRGLLAVLGLAARWVWAWRRLTAQWLTGSRTDVVIVGYLGHLDVFLARLLTRRPVVLNALLSLHDTVVNDRRLVRPGSLSARVLRTLDRLACRAADLVLLDTQTHIDYFQTEVGLPADRFHRVWVGSDHEMKPVAVRPPGSFCRVLFVGTFIPLHGVTTILEAAQRLEQARVPVRLRIVGRGQEFPAAAARVRGEGLELVELVDRWINREDYERELTEADVCLGIFGATAKAQRVIPSKVYDALAAGRPIITADTPAARELLTHGEDAWLCPANHAAALADAITALAEDSALRERLARGARRTYETRCSPEVIGKDVVAKLEQLTSTT